MKTEISRDSHQVEKRYSGVYQQQGRMLTDADWNELVEILKLRLDESLKDVVGSTESGIGGAPRHRALRIISADSSNVEIRPGLIYIDGLAARLLGDASISNVNYASQGDFPEAPDLTSDYLIYADVWERTVTQLMDERLRDKGLHGADTCTRKQTLAQVKLCPYDAADPDKPGNDPETWVKNPRKGNATLNASLLKKTTEIDPCDPCAAELDVASRIGNYLFRVEVHNVVGDADNPDSITLKWSSENGAEQFVATEKAADMPAGFISDKWVYEFFGEVSERHLGVHLAEGDWKPWRADIARFRTPEDYGAPPKPESNGSSDPEEAWKFIRRWDGYITLKSGLTELDTGVDRGVDLDVGSAEGSLGHVNISSNLEIFLETIRLELTLTGKSFVAGDYWLVEVREAEHDPDENSMLAEHAPPRGIEHRYLTLGRVVDENLQDNPEIDRKYSFPPLTEMTRLFHAGGDGQEAMPGNQLPQPLEVGVANGEWPVEDALVAFTLRQGGGVISESSAVSFDEGLIVETDEHGIASCDWELGPLDSGEQRVEARLVDPDSIPPDNVNFLKHPPVFFNADLSKANQVAYDPECESSVPDTVHNLLASDTPPAIGNANPDYYTVKEVLDSVLCKLKAKHLPYDPAIQSERWEDINESDSEFPRNVQDAIDQLIANLEASDVIYRFLDSCDVTAYGVKSLNSYIREDLGKIDPDSSAKIEDLWNTVLCLLDANRIPYDSTIRETIWNECLEESLFGSIDADRLIMDGRGLAHRAVIDPDDDNLVSISSAIEVGRRGRATLNFNLRKLDSQGSTVWSKRFPAIASAIAISSNRDIFVTGYYNQPLDFGEEQLQLNRFGIKAVNTIDHQGSGSSTVAARELPAVNTIAAQKLVISISDNDTSVDVKAGAEASDVAAAVNELRVISARASTTAILDQLNAPGSVSFDLADGGATPVGISAEISDPADLAPLVAAVNKASLDTGISAKVVKGASVELYQADGRDIRIFSFKHSAAAASISIHGPGDDISGQKLVAGAADSVIVSGSIEFYAEVSFDLISSVDNLKGSLLDQKSGEAVTAELSGDSANIFIAKFDPSGKVIWSRGYGDWGMSFPSGLAVSAEGDALMTGYFSGSTVLGKEILKTSNGPDGFVFKIEGDKGTPQWVRPMQNDDTVLTADIELGKDGNIVVTGEYSGTLNLGNDRHVSAGPKDAFVALVDTGNGKILWSRSVGGAGDESGTSLSIDRDNDIVLVVNSSEGYQIDGIDLPGIGTRDTVVHKLSYADASVKWARRFGGSGTMDGLRVHTDKDSSILVTGSFTNSITTGEHQLSSNGKEDAFLVRLDRNGGHVWTTSAGGPETDIGMGIASLSTGQLIWSWANLPQFVMPGSGQQSEFNVRILDEAQSLTLPVNVQRAIDALLDIIKAVKESTIHGSGPQFMTGPLTIDDGPGTPASEQLLSVRGPAEMDGIKINAGSLNGGFVLTLDAATGMGTWQAPSGEGWSVSGKMVYTEINGDTDVIVGIGTNAPETPLTILGNGGQHKVGITQKQVGGSATMELTTTDSQGQQATRLLLRGNGDNADIEFYRGPRAGETRSMMIDGDTGNLEVQGDVVANRASFSAQYEVPTNPAEATMRHARNSVIANCAVDGGQTPSLLTHWNVSSITRIGPGDYLINLDIGVARDSAVPFGGIKSGLFGGLFSTVQNGSFVNATSWRVFTANSFTSPPTRFDVDFGFGIVGTPFGL